MNWIHTPMTKVSIFTRGGTERGDCMYFEQVKFRTVNNSRDVELGGIAVYKYERLLGVICGCCGSWHRAKDVIIIESYEDWLDLGTAIVEVHDEADEWDDEE